MFVTIHTFVCYYTYTVKSVSIVSMVKYITIVCERLHLVKYITIVFMVKFVTIKPFHKSLETIVTDLTI